MKRSHRTLLFSSLGLIALLATTVLALAQSKPDLGLLKGRWVRPDGGYIIEIRSVDAGGRMEAGYFNPNPIHVARAAATLSGEVLTVFLELRGPGYPGSTYNLVYDPQGDELKGVYHHAGLQADFEVVFTKIK